MLRRAWKGAKQDAVSDPSKKRVRTPILLQMHASECGAACLGSILGHFGRWAPLTELREKCEVSRDGSSAASIMRASRHYGLECSGLSIRAEALKKVDLPVIVFWQFSHFLIVEGFDSRYFHLNDPSTGRRRLSAEEFNKGYSGITLRFKPRDDFKPGGERPGLFGQLQALLRGSSRVLTWIVACGLMLTLLALVVPASLSAFVDDVLNNHGPWGGLVTALIGGGVLVYILSLLKHRFLKRFAVRVSVIGYSQALSRMLRLPVEFFEHRLVGDLTDRVSSTDRVAKNLTEEFLVLLVDMAMSAVLLLAMLAYDVVLTLIVLALALLHGSLARILGTFRAVRSQAMRREQGLLIGVGMQMLQSADNLRMTGSDDRFFSRWSGQQARELEARQRYAELGAVNTAFPGLIAALRSAVILGVGGKFRDDGRHEPGNPRRVLHPGGDVPGANRALSGIRRQTPGARNRPAAPGGTSPRPPKIPFSPVEVRSRCRSPRSEAAYNSPASLNSETSPSGSTRANRRSSRTSTW